jgi:DNA polymerase III subunit gamma/tau
MPNDAEAYQVIARKHRPQQFDDVVGQRHVTDTLKNALRLGRVAHAYLFVGPRGIGKTTISRIFAKTLNCREGKPGEPCDRCDSCVEIMAGRSMDVIEIDGASNNSVEQVRDLRDKARYLPTRGPLKIYIIDEVHMLSTAAFNALLKTLEEPPAHVKFIFATTDPQKLPATIISRCQRFDLRRISARDIADHLRKICGLEAVEISDDALAAIARGAEGGLRDAETALDQLIAFCGRSITEEHVLSVFGLVSRQRLEELARALLAGRVEGIMAILDELDRHGKDMKRVLQELLDWFRNLLAWLYLPDPARLELPEAAAEGLRDAAGGADAGRVMRMIEALISTEEQMRYSLSPRTMLDIGLIRCARAATTVSVDQLMREIAALKEGLSLPPEPAAAPPVSRDPAPAAPAASRMRASAAAAPSVPAPSGDPVVEWPEIAARIAAARPLAGAALAGSSLVMEGADRGVLRIPGLKDAVRSQIERDLVPSAEKLIKKQTGHAIRLSVATAPAAGTAPKARARPADAPAAPPPSETPAPDAAGRRNVRRELLENETIQELLKTFDGRITDIHE